jgi:hypothetical protein
MSVGHGTVVETPDSRMFYLSHGYQAGDAFYWGDNLFCMSWK